MRSITFVILLQLPILFACSQPNFKINGKIIGLRSGFVSLYEYEGNRIILLDSFEVKNENLIIELSPERKNGMYHLRWGNHPQQGFDFIFNYESFSFYCHKDTIDKLKFVGSIENDFFYLFYPIIQTIEAYTQLGDYLNKKNPSANKSKLLKLNEKIDSLEIYVQRMLEIYSNKYNNLFSYKIIRTLAVADYEYEYQQGRTPKIDPYIFTRNNFFKYFVFDEPALTRTPILQKLLQEYFTLYVPESTYDSFIVAIDTILQRASINSEVYKYVLSLLMNTFEQSDFLEVYLYLYEKYYSKLISDIDGRKQTYELIKRNMPGMKMYDFEAQTINNQKFKLSHNFSAKLGLLFIWDPDCEHCREFIEKLKPIHQSYKHKGFEIIAFAIVDDFIKWKEAVGKYQIQNWINVSDLQGLLSPLFDNIHIRGTPEIYIFNKQYIILTRPSIIEEIDEYFRTDR